VYILMNPLAELPHFARLDNVINSTSRTPSTSWRLLAISFYTLLIEPESKSFDASDEGGKARCNTDS
jgi:hypothetical protein